MTIQNIYHPDGEPAERLIIERDFERDRVIVTVDNHGARELISMSTTDMRALLHSAGLL